MVQSTPENEIPRDNDTDVLNDLDQEVSDFVKATDMADFVPVQKDLPMTLRLNDNSELQDIKRSSPILRNNSRNELSKMSSHRLSPKGA